MSDDRISAGCPYCGETYNLLSSQAGNWFKCRNDQCRRGFIVEGPSGSTDRSDTDLPTSPLNTQSESQVATPAGADGIALISAITGAPDPVTETQGLLQAFNRATPSTETGYASAK